MIKITIKETAEVTGGELISSSPDEIVSGFSIDSRTVKPGQLFIAVKGENFDGHDFISEAFRAGAKGFIVSCLSKENRETPPGHVIVVNDTVSAMGKLAGYI
ncbi:MAG: UDP-N-acetylmuramoyl-tripeptide--D-alanyl-D-alanine ligase, partial [Candidatus Omnitrophica bacterium]|nr:UDP-N-acetylmuramoyl-tripeptide--D-alanyl-D-alanine ligase [Candidatus Omnitrophota bacterium]